MFLWNIAVTSLAEVWIEIEGDDGDDDPEESLPLRKCGLKFPETDQQSNPSFVTSLAEVWIEIGAK